jgi:Family of unknown function (DUF6206)
MEIDRELLAHFEAGLNPQALEESPIPAAVLGYGEISIILQIGDNPDLAYKRMPLFSDRESAERYQRQFHEYCGYLSGAGLHLPKHETLIVEVKGRPVVLYIAQERLPGDRFAHRLIHALEPGEATAMLERIIVEIEKVWYFNASSHPVLQLAIDAQVSNWVVLENDEILYIDTSTPLYRKEGAEQMDPELFLQSAPVFLRWLIRWLFLKDVMNRYYDPRLVYMDLAANLFKEQCPELISDTVGCINRHLPAGHDPMSHEEVEKYYKEDKLIWTLFLAFRRIDRWMTTRLFRNRYEFLIPGKIER